MEDILPCVSTASLPGAAPELPETTETGIRSPARRRQRRLNAVSFRPEAAGELTAHMELAACYAARKASLGAVRLKQLSEGEASASNRCCVCLNQFQVEENLGELIVCKHLLHLSCLRSCLEHSPFCPLCRCDLSTDLPGGAPLCRDAISGESVRHMTGVFSPRGAATRAQRCGKVRHDTWPIQRKPSPGDFQHSDGGRVVCRI
mmetsp:Transcript_66691/g.145423  ORF Transcript_66691/g.145423 Transcript_66691/m.145423 type:complete len:204 (-) Transcript_66691:274-885(-)